MSKKGVIVVGSSRRDGETKQIVDLVEQKSGFEVVNLLDHEIGHFDYDNRHGGDDFIPLASRLAVDFEVIVLATPVYWYSMSGRMKDFLDRFTDLLRFEKAIGRRFRGKSLAIVTSSSGENVPSYFHRPFEDTAEYLGMAWLGALDSWVVEGEVGVSESTIDDFCRRLKN